MRSNIRSWRALRSFAFASLVAACACMDMDGPRMYLPGADEPVDSVLDKDDATRIAESALIAFNEGDFEGFSASWGPEMRSMIQPADFASIRKKTLEAAGRYVAILDARKTSPVDGYVRFTFLCEFERDELIYFIAFPVDSSEASAAYLGPPTE